MKMNVSDVKFQVTTTWWSIGLTNAFSFGSASDPREKSEIDEEMIHEISEENFVHLERRGDRCSITVTLDSYRISKISIVSDSRLVEVYGQSGEYVGTVKGVLLSESEDRDIYNAQLDVSIFNEVTLKFPVSKDSLWLYGVKILLDEVAPNQTGINYSHINDILQSSKVPLSDRARQALTSLQNQSNRPSDVGALLKLLQSGQGDKTCDLSKLMGRPETTDMKKYVDDSIHHLEERLQTNLQKQITDLETKQNEKLDAILNLLKNK